ncbi:MULTISPECIES: DUF2797 domain-containing protein [unclassified Rhodococcus (in: high G+C Gram-positive bacteria)]|uniref:DUF2797 domain-containing protein n=1 Tax=unclassified Rhodococcus (in: high G+C Gram-positive bacteria) TaxID=192944 RepID=UPI0027DFE982|nr:MULTISPECIES: DUF2797 domain-containing protein [unclassified Rhodococcus (in: high G+C Gram-positive bacteria)]
METRDVAYVELRGARIGFESLGDGRWCTGRVAFSPKGSEYVPCPTQSPAEVGAQCEVCESKDPFRFVHTVHRGGFVSRDLEAHVMQPHWLYIATFANGVHKVGTAANTRKWGRLAEQGAICAQYVAWATDGKVIRVLEDKVTEVLQVRQSVRSSAKAAALALPVDTARLDAATAALAGRVRDILGPGDDSFHTVDEAWRVAGFRDLASGNRVAYPSRLDSGTHGFTVDACIGQTAVVDIDGESYVVDLHELTGRRVRFGDYDSTLPAVQSALF